MLSPKWKTVVGVELVDDSHRYIKKHNINDLSSARGFRLGPPRGVSRKSPTGKLKNVTLTPPPCQFGTPEVFSLKPLIALEWQERVQEVDKRGEPKSKI